MAMAVLLAGCDRAPAEVGICEGYIKATLAAPATYARASFTSADEPLADEAAFERRVGLVAPRRTDLDYQVWDLTRGMYAGSRIGLRSTAISYDAADDAGTPTRRTTVCGFRLVDGELGDLDHLRDSAERAARPDPLVTLAVLKGQKPRPRPRIACCY